MSLRMIICLINSKADTAVIPFISSTKTGKTYLCQDNGLLWRARKGEKARGQPLGRCGRNVLILALGVKIQQAVPSCPHFCMFITLPRNVKTKSQMLEVY